MVNKSRHIRRWKGKRLIFRVVAILAILILLVIGSGIVSAFYWINKNPDVYPYGVIVDGVASGEVGITPALAERSSYQSFTLTFRAGNQGIKEGGGLILRLGEIIRIEGEPRFYDFSFQDMWQDTLQITSPSQGGYVTVKSPSGVKISLSKPSHAPHRCFLTFWFAATANRFRNDLTAPSWFLRNMARRHEVHLRLTEGYLMPGDELQLVLGDISGGAEGWRMPGGEASTDFIFYVDESGDGKYRMVSSYATIEVGGGEMELLKVIAPSTPLAGEDFNIVIQALDEEKFISSFYEGTIMLLPHEGLEFPRKKYTFSPLDRGTVMLTVKAAIPGTYRIKVKELYTGKIYTGNPIVVLKPQAEKRIFWGDIHQHTALGKDANRTPEHALEHDRRVDLLDFVAISVHDFFLPWGITLAPEEWQYLLELNDRFYVPGEFVTFHSYEWTDTLYHGQRNILWDSEEEPVLASFQHESTPEKLRQALGGTRYLVIPQHTAWRGFYPDVPYNWGPADWEQLRLVEIFSKHGSSDYFDGRFPIHHDVSPWWIYFFGERSVRAHEGLGSYVREALAKGYRMGFIAASDNHWSREGEAIATLPYVYMPGLQAVYAPELTREALFEAMWQRHTYATTGARIIVEFNVNDAPMGSEIIADSNPTISFAVIGTAPIEKLEIWKHSDSKGFERFLVDGKGLLEIRGEIVDEEFQENSFYFLHVIQADGHLAWASPIWVDKPE